MFVAVLLQAHEGGQVQTIARTFGVDWPHLTAQIISFSIVCALLFWFAYRPILNMLDERRRQIAQGLANADKIKAELAQTEAQRQEVLRKASGEAAAIIEEAHTAADRLKARETQQAIATAAQIVAKAREVAAQEHVRMLSELKREIGHLVIEATSAFAGKVLTPEDERRLAEQTLDRMAKAA